MKNDPPNYLTTVSGEEQLLSIRKHWINFVPVVVSCTCLAAALFAAVYFSGRYGDQISHYLPLSIVGLIVLVGFGVVALIAGLGLWIFTQNRLILTNYHL